MGAFKVWYTKKGKSRESGKWYVDFKDHNEVRRRIPGFTDLRSTEEMETKLGKLVADVQNGDPPRPELTGWLSNMPNALRERLIKFGLIDTHRASAAKPIEAHLQDWQRALEDKGTTGKQAKLVTGRARRVFVQANVKKLAQIDGVCVQRAIAALCQQENLGAQTFNFYQNAAKQFCRWLDNENRITRNPIKHLEGREVKADRRHDRRALTADESRALLRATEQAPERWGMTGSERALVYRLALETGLRANELKSLTVADFTLTAKTATVRVMAAYAKNRRTDELPLRPETAALLKAHAKHKLPAATMFNLRKSDYTAKMLREDLKAAGIDYRDSDGRVVDFHALRHSFISAFANNGNVNLSVAQRLARHSSPVLTARYTHVSAASERGALSALPDLDAEPEQAKKQG